MYHPGPRQEIALLNARLLSTTKKFNAAEAANEGSERNATLLELTGEIEGKLRTCFAEQAAPEDYLHNGENRLPE